MAEIGDKPIGTDANSAARPERIEAQLDGLSTWGIGRMSLATAKQLACAPEPTELEDRKRRLDEASAAVAACKKCRLCEARTRTVYGVGDLAARLVFVGEAPGQEEDRRGEPFVGRAGQLLDKMIQAMGLARQQVYICNVVKCRPPENRTPLADEIAACSPYLLEQLRAIGPEAIVLLGKPAANSVLANTNSVGSMRGRSHEFEGIPAFVTYHPAYLLRNPPAKKDAWADLQIVMRFLGLPGAGP